MQAEAHRDHRATPAHRVIQALQLSLEDSQDFVAALLDPPSPNEALKAAALRHQQVLSKE